MKTLSQLIEEAEERFEEKFAQKIAYINYNLNEGDASLSKDDIKTFLKTELETIVKESFKNTRVEEREIPDTKIEELTETGKINRAYKVGFNDALSDKHNKECEFLGK